jgi:organic radical activating enzyme
MQTLSICPTCYKKIPAKIVFSEGKVLMQKSCLEHGSFESVMETDIQHFSNFYRVGTKGLNNNIIIHVEDKCNMTCSWCYHDGKEEKQDFAYYNNLLSMYRDRGFKLLLSGGEPTIRPDYFKFLQEAKNLGWNCTTITNMLSLADEGFFIEALRHNFSANLFDYALSFQHPKNYSPDELTKKLAVADRLKSMCIRAQCVAFSISSLEELDFIRDFYDNYKDIALMWRIRTLFRTWENKDSKERVIYRSELNKAFIDKFSDLTPIVSEDIEISNIYCMYMKMDGGRYVSLSSAPTVDNVDYHICSRPVYMLARDLRCHPVPLAQICNEGISKGWLDGFKLSGGNKCG